MAFIKRVVKGYKGFKNDWERSSRNRDERTIQSNERRIRVLESQAKVAKAEAGVRKYKTAYNQGGGRGAAMLSTDFIGGFGGSGGRKKKGRQQDFSLF